MTTPRQRGILIALPTAAAVGLTYHHVLAKLAADWAANENYSHGFLIIPVSLYFVWERRRRLAAAVLEPSYWGLSLVVASLALLGAGVLGAELFTQRVSLLGVLAGAVWFLCGRRHLRILLFPIAFLLLMIPIPAIVFNHVAFPLQLLASRFGEAALTALGIPVLREGNVITLATTTLEVAEACSGIRSLVSLLSVAVVFGYLTDRRYWVRSLLAVASLPIAIVANGIRVAGTGVAAHRFGEDAAQGFFHSFSGWVVFLVAVVLLLAAEWFIRILAPLPKPRASGEPSPVHTDVASASPVRLPWLRAGALAATLVLCWAGIASASRAEQVPPRESLATFPLQLGNWRGTPAPRFSQQVLAVLGVDEYITRDYRSPRPGAVHVYIGYYRSQREGDTIHSPLNCLPGAGWEPTDRSRLRLTVRTAPGPESDVRTIDVNRLLIQRGEDRQVVLYWYQSRNRVIASEYLGKFFTVVDAIRVNRTDAAMIRLMSPLERADTTVEAEQRATEVAQALFPYLSRYLPE